MAFAQKVATEYKELEAGYRDKLYKFIGSALTSYRMFLRGNISRKALLSQDVIAGLREKPDLRKTSRLLLYFLTDAKNEAERNSAGKYASIVDYLDKERVPNADAADYVRCAGGINAILKKARKRQALKPTPTRDDDRDFDNGEEFEETGTFTSASSDELFDPEVDISTRVGSETRKLVLSSEIPMDEVFYLECRKTEPLGSDGILILGRLVNLESE
jgi:hypothetical protein